MRWEGEIGDQLKEEGEVGEGGGGQEEVGEGGGGQEEEEEGVRAVSECQALGLSAGQFYET